MGVRKLPLNQQILAALRILFGPDVPVSPTFLARLTPSTLKTVYRRKALQTHPDRAMVILRPPEELNDHFKQVTSAYQTISTAMARRQTAKFPISPKTRARPHRTAAKHRRTRRMANRFYSGPLPRRPLLIGQFLYYSGMISWKDLIDAIVWQKKQRPLIGQIARDWNMLSWADIAKVLSTRRPGERFGECSYRQGLINTFQQMALVGRQRRLQQPIGRHFISKGLFSDEDLNRMVDQMKRHNQRYKNRCGNTQAGKAGN